MLIGNLTRDPEVKLTSSGKAVGNLGLAINRSYKNAAGEKLEDVTFVDVELWGRLAEIAGEYAKKGQPIFIEGGLRMDSWEDKQTGQKRSKLKVVGEGLQLLSRDNKTERAPIAQKAKENVQAKSAEAQGPESDGPADDDIPF